MGVGCVSSRTQGSGVVAREKVELRCTWKKRNCLQKATDFDFGLGECTGTMGYPIGGMQLAVWDCSEG